MYVPIYYEDAVEDAGLSLHRKPLSPLRERDATRQAQHFVMKAKSTIYVESMI